MILYNYTSLRQRDTKIYNVGGYNIAGGMSVEFLKIVGPVAFSIIVFGVILGIPFGINFINPFSSNFIPQYTITFIVLGILAGCALWYIPIAGYKLYQYLFAYFKPKHVYVNDFKNTIYTLTNFSIKTFIRNIF